MTEELWPGGPQYKDEESVFRIGMDSVLLAHYACSAHLKKIQRAVDLGCGAGIISVLLALNYPGLHIDGIEIQAPAASLAAENARLSDISGRLNIIEGDLRDHRRLFAAGAYDLVVSNPPYYTSESGKSPLNNEAAAARSEQRCTLADVCRAAGYLTRFSGAFFLVHKPERLAIVIKTLQEHGFEPKRLRFVQFSISSPPNLMLIESKRGGKPTLRVEAPLILTDANGSETDEIKSIYHRNAR